MIRELKGSYSYKKVITVLSILSLIFGFAFSLFGEMLLPLAVAFYAALILFERPKGRLFSYLVPSVVIAISLVLNGFYGLISLEYVLLAVVLVLVYIRCGSKAECSLYLTIISAVFIVIALYLGAARVIEDFSIEAVASYYSDIYNGLKNQIVSYLITLPEEEKTIVNEAVVQQYFDLLSNMLVSVFAIFAFILSGVTIKIFFALLIKYSKNGILKTFLHFMPASIVAYSYIAVTIFYLLSNSNSLFSVSIFNVYEILMIVFAYVGARFIYLMGKINRRKIVIFIMAAAFLIAFGFTINLLSYLGIFVTVNSNKNTKYMPEK